MEANEVFNMQFCIHHMLKPLLMNMEIFGIYFAKENELSVTTSKRGTLPRLSLCRKIYSIAVLIFLWVNVIRYIPSFWVGFDFQPDATVNRVVIQTWLIQCAITVSIILWYCYKGVWNTFYLQWHDIITGSCCSGYLVSKIKRMRIICKLFLAIGIMFFTFNVVSQFVLALVFNTSSITTNPFPPTADVASILIILEFFDIAAWIFPTIFMIAICYFIRLAFAMVTEALRCSVQSQNKCSDYWISLRKTHLKLCRLVDYLDKPLRLWIANIISFNVFMACFILYDLIRTQQNKGVEIALKVSWLTGNFLTVFVSCWFIATVNVSAHSPLEYIYDIRTEGLTTHQLGQLTLFLSKLTGTSIGFTAMGFFTITKEVILTIAGLYLTYFFLLLQFKIS